MHFLSFFFNLNHENNLADLNKSLIDNIEDEFPCMLFANDIISIDETAQESNKGQNYEMHSKE